MDILSSQANLPGYRSVIDSSYEFNRAVPMMMTAAGTVTPAKFFIIGAGVAGLWSALLCAKNGHDVRVYEAQSEHLKEACSFRAGGMLAPFCEEESAEPEITALGARSIALYEKYFPEYIYKNGSLLVRLSYFPRHWRPS